MKSLKLQFKIQSFKDHGLTKVFLFLTILLAPLYVVRFKVGGYPSTLLEVLVGLTVVAWAVERLRGREGQEGQEGQEGVKFNFPIALFVLAAAVSVVVSPDKRGALGIFRAYFIEPILIFFIIKDVVKSKKDWWLVFSALVLSGLWIALLAVFQGLTGQFTFAPHEAALGRAHAVYNTANAVGLYLGPIILLVLGVLGRFGEFGAFRVFGVIGVGLMMAAVLLSRSTGALVGLTTALLVPSACCLVPKDWRKWVARVVRVAGVIGIIVAVWFFFNISQFTPESVDPYVRKSTDTLQFRLCLWEGTRDMLLDRPIFGSGLSGFKELYSQKYFTCDAEPLEYPHNWVLNFWAETGILGLLGFLGILGWYYEKVRRVERVEKGIKVAFAAAMVYWLIHGLVDVPYFKNDLSLEFWVIVGLACKLPFSPPLSCFRPNREPQF